MMKRTVWLMCRDCGKHRWQRITFPNGSEYNYEGNFYCECGGGLTTLITHQPTFSAKGAPQIR